MPPRSRLVSVFVFTFVGVFAAGMEGRADTVRVIVAQANVRLEPNQTSPVILKVTAGTVLDVEAKEGDWYRVSLPPDSKGLKRVGYVSQSVVKLTIQTTPAGSASPPIGGQQIAAPPAPTPMVVPSTIGASERLPNDSPSLNPFPPIDPRKRPAEPLATEAEVVEAVRVGRTQSDSTFLVTCVANTGWREDLGRTLLSSGTQPTRGYDVVIANHLGIISAISQQWKREYKSLSVQDVTAELRQPGVFVVASPAKMTAFETASPVEQIVVRSRAKRNALIQPFDLYVSDVTEAAKAEGIFGYMYKASFSLKDLDDLPAGDLDVVIVTAHGERNCKVGAKDRAKFSHR